jgi:hypothetical protein
MLLRYDEMLPDPLQTSALISVALLRKKLHTSAFSRGR